MRELAHLIRYYVVDRHSKPWGVAPYRVRQNAEAEARRLNYTTDVKGLAEMKPFRVVILVPQEMEPARPRSGPDGGGDK